MTTPKATEIVLPEKLVGSEIAGEEFSEAWRRTNRFLVDLPATFSVGAVEFYQTLNIRNTSGFIGEVFKHALASHSSNLVANPHRDGTPDLLSVSKKAARSYFEDRCVDAHTGAPIRSELTRFKYGGVEVKCAIGTVRGASKFPVGVSRVDSVTGLSYWSHHRNDCRLLGFYFDFDEVLGGAPQIRAAFYSNIRVDDWTIVSQGRPDRKKTSNCQLNAVGIAKMKQGLAGYTNAESVRHCLRRIGVTLPR